MLRDRFALGRHAEWLLCLAVVGLAVGHALAVAPHYHVGSFDDDASYLETARALTRGAGLTSTLTAGYPLVATYPPGYPLLLAPLMAVFGDALWPERALSLACFALLIPLTWWWLRRLRLSVGFTLAVTALLALNPAAATFATMVMAETPFLVLLMILWIGVDRWALGTRRWPFAAVVVASAYLIYLKEAGFGLFAGLLLWLLLRRRPGRALAAAVGVGLLILPILLARASVSSPLIGSRYSREIGGSITAGGPGHVIGHVVPQAIWHYLTAAVPATLMPVAHLPTDLGGVVRASMTPIVLIGLASWLWQRRTEAAVLMTFAYLAETLLFPYINQRRVILVLPIVLAWLVEGVRVIGLALGWVLRRWAPPAVLLPAAVTGALAVSAVAVVPLAPQFDRDYLFAEGSSTSKPFGSVYMRMLAALGKPADVVETDYLWTTSYATGHRTAKSAVRACTPSAAPAALRSDHASYVLISALNHPGLVDTPCLLDILESDPSAVRLLRTPADSSTVYQLVGPGSPHPTWHDVTPPRPSAPTVAVRGSAVLTTGLGHPVEARQVSVGGVVADSGQVTGASLWVRTAGGRWRQVATAPAFTRRQRTDFLLWAPARPTRITAVRVAVRGHGVATVQDLHVLADSAATAIP